MMHLIEKDASREVNAVLDGIGLSDEEKQAEQHRVGQQIKNVYSMWYDAVNEKQKRLAQEVAVQRRQIEDTYTALQRPYDGATVSHHIIICISYHIICDVLRGCSYMYDIPIGCSILYTIAVERSIIKGPTA